MFDLAFALKEKRRQNKLGQASFSELRLENEQLGL